MIDYPPPSLDREVMFATVRAELRAEHRRLTDAQIDLIADVAIELRMVRDSIVRRAGSGRDHRTSPDVQPPQAPTHVRRF